MLGYALLTVVLVFVASLWRGWETPPDVGMELIGRVREAAGPWLNQGPAVLFLIIFVNNAAKAFLALLLGVGFGVVPLFFVASNGYLLGAVVKVVAGEEGLSTTIAGLLPHGVIELPAALFASALGIAVGWEAVLHLLRRDGRVGPRLRQAVGLYLRWILPALLVAAAVEVFITPLVMRWIAAG